MSFRMIQLPHSCSTSSITSYSCGYLFNADSAHRFIVITMSDYFVFLLLRSPDFLDLLALTHLPFLKGVKFIVKITDLDPMKCANVSAIRSLIVTARIQSSRILRQPDISFFGILFRNTAKHRFCVGVVFECVQTIDN